MAAPPRETVLGQGDKLADLTLPQGKSCSTFMKPNVSHPVYFWWSCVREMSGGGRQDRFFTVNESWILLLEGWKPSGKCKTNVTRCVHLTELEKMYMQNRGSESLLYLQTSYVHAIQFKKKGGEAVEPTWKLRLFSGESGGLGSASIVPAQILNALYQRYPESKGSNVPCIIIPPHVEMPRDPQRFGPFKKPPGYKKPKEKMAMSVPPPPAGSPVLIAPRPPTPPAPEPIEEPAPLPVYEPIFEPEPEPEPYDDYFDMPEPATHIMMPRFRGPMTLHVEGDAPNFLPRDVCLSAEDPATPKRLPVRRKDLPEQGGWPVPAQQQQQQLPPTFGVSPRRYQPLPQQPERMSISVSPTGRVVDPLEDIPGGSGSLPPHRSHGGDTTRSDATAGPVDVPSVHLELVLKDTTPWASPLRTQVVDDHLPQGIPTSQTLGLPAAPRPPRSHSHNSHSPPTGAGGVPHSDPLADGSFLTNPADASRYTAGGAANASFAPRSHNTSGPPPASAVYPASKSQDRLSLPAAARSSYSPAGPSVTPGPVTYVPVVDPAGPQGVPYIQCATGPGPLHDQPSLGPVVTATTPQLPARGTPPPVHVLHDVSASASPRSGAGGGSPGRDAADPNLDAEVAQALLEHARSLEERVQTLETREIGRLQQRLADAEAKLSSPERAHLRSPGRGAHPPVGYASQTTAQPAAAASSRGTTPRGAVGYDENVMALVRSVQDDIDAETRGGARGPTPRRAQPVRGPSPGRQPFRPTPPPGASPLATPAVSPTRHGGGGGYLPPHAASSPAHRPHGPSPIRRAPMPLPTPLSGAAVSPRRRGPRPESQDVKKNFWASFLQEWDKQQAHDGPVHRMSL